jgi:hypothetical protein
MKHLFPLLALTLAVLFSSCEKEPVPVTNVGEQQQNITATLTAYYVDTHANVDTAMQGVEVNLYESEQDRTDMVNATKTGTTGVDGKITFEYLKVQDYFVEATYTGMRTERFILTINPGTVAAYEDILMKR